MLGEIDAGLFQFMVGEERNAFFARAEILPEGVDVSGQGESPGHADDGDAFLG
jgi:hypothetical protein